MTRRALTAFLLALTLLFCNTGIAADLAQQIDELAKAVSKPDEPGFSLLVTQNGQPVVRKGYGMANLELAIPIQPEMTFRIGSMTKQFTAVAVLMLMEQGKLALTDELTKYFPDYPVQGRKITIQHLLTHTSGIKSYTDMQEFLAKMRVDMTLQELIDFFKNQPLDFEPGQKWKYNNSGYVLLGAIIEKVSGMTYYEFLKKKIFDPLGMKHTYYGDVSAILPGRVPGYARGKEGYENAQYLSMTQPYSAGALVSNVDDLAKWDEALYTEKLIKQSSLQKAWAPFQLSDGRSTRYGFGWASGEYEGHDIIIHGGSINGFQSAGIRMPEDHTYIVILANDETKNPESLGTKIAALVAGKPLAVPAAIRLTPEKLDQYAGVYQVDEKEQRFVRREGAKLYSQRSGGAKYELIPYAEHLFYIADNETRFRFNTDRSGKIVNMQRIEVLSYGPEEIALKTDLPLPEPRKAIAIDPARLDQYAGRYELAPGFEIAITRQGNSLMSLATGQQQAEEIFPESETLFFLENVDATLEFTRDASGTIDGLILRQGGQEMRAKKQNPSR